MATPNTIGNIKRVRRQYFRHNTGIPSKQSLARAQSPAKRRPARMVRRRAPAKRRNALPARDSGPGILASIRGGVSTFASHVARSLASRPSDALTEDDVALLASSRRSSSPDARDGTCPSPSDCDTEDCGTGTDGDTAHKSTLECDEECKSNADAPRDEELEASRKLRASARESVRHQDETWRTATHEVASFPLSTFAMMVMASATPTCREALCHFSRTIASQASPDKGQEQEQEQGVRADEDGGADQGTPCVDECKTPCGADGACGNPGRTTAQENVVVLGTVASAAFEALCRANKACVFHVATDATKPTKKHKMKLRPQALFAMDARSLASAGLSFDVLSSCKVVEPHLHEFRVTAAEWIAQLGASPSQVADLCHVGQC